MTDSSSPATWQRRQCPDCPDGNEWTAHGPTGRACQTCGGNAYIVRDGPHRIDATASPYDVSGNPTKEYPGE